MTRHFFQVLHVVHTTNQQHNNHQPPSRAFLMPRMHAAAGMPVYEPPLQTCIAGQKRRREEGASAPTTTTTTEPPPLDPPTPTKRPLPRFASPPPCERWARIDEQLMEADGTSHRARLAVARVTGPLAHIVPREAAALALHLRTRAALRRRLDSLRAAGSFHSMSRAQRATARATLEALHDVASDIDTELHATLPRVRTYLRFVAAVRAAIRDTDACAEKQPPKIDAVFKHAEPLVLSLAS